MHCHHLCVHVFATANCLEVHVYATDAPLGTLHVEYTCIPGHLALLRSHATIFYMEIISNEQRKMRTLYLAVDCSVVAVLSASC